MEGGKKDRHEDINLGGEGIGAEKDASGEERTKSKMISKKKKIEKVGQGRGKLEKVLAQELHRK